MHSHSAGPFVFVVLAPDVLPPSQQVQVSIPRNACVADLKREACAELFIKEDDVDLWDYFGGRCYACLEERLSHSIINARLMDRQAVLLKGRHGKPLTMSVFGDSWSKPADVLLVFDDGSHLPAHRCILELCSPLLQDMFAQGLSKASELGITQPTAQNCQQQQQQGAVAGIAASSSLRPHSPSTPSATSGARADMQCLTPPSTPRSTAAARTCVNTATGPPAIGLTQTHTATGQSHSGAFHNISTSHFNLNSNNSASNNVHHVGSPGIAGAMDVAAGAVPRHRLSCRTVPTAPSPDPRQPSITPDVHMQSPTCGGSSAATASSLHSADVATEAPHQAALDDMLCIRVPGDERFSWVYCLQLLYPCCYMRRPPVTWNNIGRVLALADKWMITSVVRVCEDFLLLPASQFSTNPNDPAYVWSWLVLADRLNMPLVVRKCIAFIQMARIAAGNDRNQLDQAVQQVVAQCNPAVVTQLITSLCATKDELQAIK